MSKYTLQTFEWIDHSQELSMGRVSYSNKSSPSCIDLRFKSNQLQMLLKICNRNKIGWGD